MPKKTLLGKSIIKRKGQSSMLNGDTQTRESHIIHETGLQSITQENDLDAFLRTAELSSREFTTERNLQIIGDSALRREHGDGNDHATFDT
ncbi:hypothetical protein MP638_003314, partial [Amoeboaphelidium occidentale]